MVIKLLIITVKSFRNSNVKEFKPDMGKNTKMLHKYVLPGKCSGDFFITGFSAKWHHIKAAKILCCLKISPKRQIWRKEGENTTLAMKFIMSDGEFEENLP